jgi:hypothetical protein
MTATQWLRVIVQYLVEILNEINKGALAEKDRLTAEYQQNVTAIKEHMDSHLIAKERLEVTLQIIKNLQINAKALFEYEQDFGLIKAFLGLLDRFQSQLNPLVKTEMDAIVGARVHQSADEDPAREITDSQVKAALMLQTRPLEKLVLLAGCYFKDLEFTSTEMAKLAEKHDVLITKEDLSTALSFFSDGSHYTDHTFFSARKVEDKERQENPELKKLKIFYKINETGLAYFGDLV